MGPSECNETDIDRFFNGYGRLALILLRNSYCYVFIEERQDAEDAVKEVKNVVNFPKYQLKIENLSQNTASQELRDYMKQAGEILYCQAHDNVKGVGIVQFARWLDLKWALDHFHDTKLSGRNLKLSE